jgi:phage FluMu protein Com
MSHAIKLTIYGDDTEDSPERVVELPAKKEVCPKCEGHGSILNPSIAQHAYTASEFAESFDEEEAAEYFRRGGRYDVKCPTCKGANVIDVVDVEALASARQIVDYSAWKKQEDDRAKFDREWANEMHRECMMLGEY